MKPFVQFGLCCLLAPIPSLFAEHAGGGRVSGHAGSAMAAHAPGHIPGSIRTCYGRRQGYAYGGLYGGWYEPFYDSGYDPPAAPGGSSVTVLQPAPASSIAVTETAHPVIHEYAQPESYGASPERETHPILYLIAFRDNSIRAAMAYWVADGAVHYLDADHQVKQAPLASVDRDLSMQLNRERHVPFQIE